MDNRKRLAERYVYLCDGMIIICKMNKKGGVGLTAGGSDLKLRDKHLIRRVDVVDREDTDDLKFTFELVPRDQVRNEWPEILLNNLHTNS
jgi:son of sevenless-like protein